jgi:hypothetical protein
MQASGLGQLSPSPTSYPRLDQTAPHVASALPPAPDLPQGSAAGFATP